MAIQAPLHHHWLDPQVLEEGVVEVLDGQGAIWHQPPEPEELAHQMVPPVQELALVGAGQDVPLATQPPLQKY